MSIYGLQKMIRAVNTQPHLRGHYFEAPTKVISEFDIDDSEKAALLGKDFGMLYRLGVHGLLLRPFSILHGVKEEDYLGAIRKRGRA